MTPEQQVIKSIISFCEGFETDGSPHQDTVKKVASRIAERIKLDCEIYGVELNEPLPFNTLCEEIKHNAKEKPYGL